MAETRSLSTGGMNRAPTSAAAGGQTDPHLQLESLDLPVRNLHGPGPSNVHPRVYRAMVTPVIGHLDPMFLQVMDREQEMLRRLFRTQNQATFPLPGTGTSGMEAGLTNLVEEGDRVVIGVCGFFGERIVEIATRQGAEVIRVEAEPGRIIEPEQVERALRSAGRVKLLAIVQGETSTGILQPIEAIGRLARQYEALLMVDSVTSLGGCELCADDWGVDYDYSCTQKCLSCPPGLSPVTLNERALQAIGARSRPVGSYYLDLTLLGRYWGSDRFYHHTSSSTMVFALFEALRLLEEEGLEERIARHARHARALCAGLEAMGLQLFADPRHRLPPLTTVRIPEGIDDARMRGELLAEQNLELGGGLGPNRGRIWRIGLMGYGSTAAEVSTVLTSLEQALTRQGYRVEPGAGVAAALDSLR
jgi:alanine-glyoxylate transaminase / serine-glyoxylate transaminase / serine-pyruvate transaminase